MKLTGWLLSFVFALVAIGRLAASDKFLAESNRRQASAYGKLPLSFEKNAGQTDPQVKFLARGSGYTLFLTSNEAVLRLRAQSERKADHSSRTALLRMQLIGANRDPKVIGLDELSGRSNYFIGSDPHKWRRDVPNFARVEYQAVYPGVDLIYYGTQGKLEYDFLVSPGGDTTAITLGFAGAEVRLGDQGDLLMQTSVGEVRLHKPLVYQTEEKSGDKQIIASRYRLKSDNRVTIEVGSYDKSRSLVVDPLLAYSTYVGGSNDDFGEGIAVDKSGSAYVTGYTLSTDFPVVAGDLQTTCASCASSIADVFVAKLNPTGSSLVYSTYLGGSLQEQGFAIALDTNNNAYVTGFTNSCDFPLTVGAFQTTFPNCGAGGGFAVFVTELNSSGSAMVYSTLLGGTVNDRGEAIAVNSAGQAYLTGFTNSPNFPTTPSGFSTTRQGKNLNAFFTKLNATGSALVYSTYMGGFGVAGPGNTLGFGIAIDSLGKAYVAGQTNTRNFPTTPAVFQRQCKGCSTFSDAFVSKFDPSLSGTASLVWSTFLGGTTGNSGFAIAVDSKRFVYVTGETTSKDFPVTTGAFQPSCKLDNSGNCDDAFVTKLGPAAGSLVYSSYLGGSAQDYGEGIQVDKVFDAYIAGTTFSGDFPTTNPIQPPNTGVGTDAFVTELNPAGQPVFSSNFGGANPDLANGIALDPSGSVYITGNTRSFDFPTTVGAFQTGCGNAGVCNGAWDAFVSKIIPVVADLSITNSASPKPVTSGGTLTYTIVVTNQGPDTANTLTISDVIRTGTTFNNVSISSGSCAAPAPNNTGAVTCTASTLTKGGSLTETLVVNVTAASGATIKDKVSVSAASFDPNLANNSATVFVPVQ